MTFVFSRADVSVASSCVMIVRDSQAERKVNVGTGTDTMITIWREYWKL